MLQSHILPCSFGGTTRCFDVLKSRASQDIRYRVAHACESRCTRGCKQRVPLWFSENGFRLPMWIVSIAISIIDPNVDRWSTTKLMEDNSHKQRFLTPGHQGWNDLHSLCRIGMEYYLLNNDDNNIIYWIMMIIMIMMMMIIIMIIMMTMMIIGTATIMIMIIIITTTLTMTIMKMIMIKTAQTPCQSLYKDRRI